MFQESRAVRVTQGSHRPHSLSGLECDVKESDKLAFCDVGSESTQL